VPFKCYLHRYTMVPMRPPGGGTADAVHALQSHLVRGGHESLGFRTEDVVTLPSKISNKTKLRDATTQLPLRFSSGDMDRSGCHQSVTSAIRPTRVVHSRVSDWLHGPYALLGLFTSGCVRLGTRTKLPVINWCFWQSFDKNVVEIGYIHTAQPTIPRRELSVVEANPPPARLSTPPCNARRSWR
jgi:hypothetical protein